MKRWNGRLAMALGMCVAVAGIAAAQGKLTDQDRAAIRQLSENYVAALDGCKATAYADLFTADGTFISGPRGNLVGHAALEGLVNTERHCKPGAAADASAVSHAFTKVVIEPSAEGASGKVYLPGRDGASGGHYDDVYTKTANGWRFKSRKYLSPKEETATAQ